MYALASGTKGYVTCPGAMGRQAKERKDWTYDPYTGDCNMSLNVIKRDIVNHGYLASTQRGFPRSTHSQIVMHLGHYLIYMSSCVLVEKDYLSSTNTVPKMIITIWSAINWDHSSGSPRAINYLKLISSSRPFSRAGGSKLNDCELVLKGSTSKK